MRRATLIICLSLAFPFPLRSSPNPVDLKALYGSHQWFALRVAMRSDSSPLLYRGAVAAAFNDTSEAEKLLGAVIRTDPKSADASEARQQLEDMYQRAGQYRRLLTTIDEGLAANPDDDGLKSDRATASAFTWDQTTVQQGFSKLHYEAIQGGVFIPVTVDGRPSEYAVDTDANISLLSETEAARLGLTVHSVAADAQKAEGASGVEVFYRTAEVDELTIGNIRLAHVPFLILPDNQMPFSDLPLGKRGIIGLPVLLALQTMRWSADGTFEADFMPQPREVAMSNLCFDGTDPIVEVEFMQRRLEFIADTGDRGSEFFYPFARDFPEFVEKSGKRRFLRVTGVDGSVEIPGTILPVVSLEIGGLAATLRSAHVELRPTAINSQSFYGRVGMAVYHQAREVTFDFRAMTLTLN